MAGVKLVRGAYCRAEVAAAATAASTGPGGGAGGGRPLCSPLLPGGKRAVDAAYDAAAVGLLPAVRAGRVALVVATHNAASVGAVVDAAAAAARARARRPTPHGRGVPGLSFAQLAGMADGLTASLAAGGWATAKYLPYGPPLECLPYLLRRAEENADAMGGARADARAAWREVATRLGLGGGAGGA